MAEAALAVLPVLFENIFKKLRSLIRNEFRLLSHHNEDLDILYSKLSKFQSVLEDAEVKEFKSEATREWLCKLKSVANEANSILDDALLLDSEDEDHSNDEAKHVCHSFCTGLDFTRVALRRNIGKRIASTIHKFDLLEDEKRNFSFEEITLNRETSSALCEHKVFGREEVREDIIKTLLSTAGCPNNPFLYAIVGLGGVGKTTLAQMIFNDERVEDNFETAIWVWVSQNFDAKGIMKNIIGSSSPQEFKSESLENMQKDLKKLLNEKKFLLVLDDVWNEDLDEWNKLKSSLKGGATGSSIILTTRQFTVASIVGSHGVHKLTPLSEDQCWSLFEECAFGVGSKENGELEAIGKQIVKKCGGLPLAAKNLGSSLWFKPEVSEWESVRDSEIWELPQPGGILPALRLSFNCLPSHSMKCFSFCSVFPKGYEMQKDVLIQLWMAHGFLPNRRHLDLEDIGNGVFDELVRRSFFEIPVDQEQSGKCCKMHDLMHDLAHSSMNECFCLEVRDVSIVPYNIQHFSFLQLGLGVPRNILEALSKSHPSLQTCLALSAEKYDLLPVFGDIIPFKNLNFLRALDLSTTDICDIPVSIGKMKHLRYLNLSFTRVTHLPEVICTLKTLQILKLRCCTMLERLPDRIPRLTNLRHLDIFGCDTLTHLPNGVGQLAFLRTLGLFVVGQGSGGRMKELQRLIHLGGELEIRGLENVRDAREAKDANLAEKKNMSSLSLTWGDLDEGNSSSNEAEGVLEALQPPQSLKGKLVIKGFGGSVFASWMILLENLVKIELKDCTKCDQLPPLGQLPLLKILTIEGMKSLKRIGCEFYRGGNGNGSGMCSIINSGEGRTIFASLEKLRIENMPNLEEWHTLEGMERQQTFPCPSLKRLELHKCPKLTLLPSLVLHYVERVDIYMCEKLRIRSLPCLSSLQLVGNLTGSLENINALESLEISYYDELTSLPEGLSKLGSLKTLRIDSCHALKSLPAMKIQGMRSSLVELDINECHGLTSLSQCLPNLSSLESLSVCCCNQLEFLSDSFQPLVNLKAIDLQYLPKLTFLPMIQHLHDLQTLTILGCKNLRASPQWLYNLSSLQSSSISDNEHLEFSNEDFQDLINLQTVSLWHLPKLTSLPELQHLHILKELHIKYCENLRVLPQIPQLTSLQALTIGECHTDLQARCEKGSGEYWPYIARIPDLEIGGITINRSW